MSSHRNCMCLITPSHLYGRHCVYTAERKHRHVQTECSFCDGCVSLEGSKLKSLELYLQTHIQPVSLQLKITSFSFTRKTRPSINMRVAIFLVLLPMVVAAFAPQAKPSSTTALHMEQSRREAMGKAAIVLGGLLTPRGASAFSQQLDYWVVEPSQQANGGKIDLNGKNIVTSDSACLSSLLSSSCFGCQPSCFRGRFEPTDVTIWLGLRTYFEDQLTHISLLCPLELQGEYKQFRGMFPHAAGKIASNGPYRKVCDKLA